jgi:hypothetical protein
MFIGRSYGDAGLRPISIRTDANDELRDEEFNRRLADIVSKGTAYVTVLSTHQISR